MSALRIYADVLGSVLHSDHTRIVSILRLGLYAVWIWVLLPTFQKYLRSPTKLHSRWEWASVHVCITILVQRTRGGGWCPVPQWTRKNPQNGRVIESFVSIVPIGPDSFAAPSPPPPPWICWTKSYIHTNISNLKSEPSCTCETQVILSTPEEGPIVKFENHKKVTYTRI